MAAGLVEGAVIGIVFQELLNLVKDVKTRSAEFKSVLDRLEETLVEISPTIKEIQDLNDELEKPTKELRPLLEYLKEGKELVRKCSKISKWNVYRTYKFWSKIAEWEVKIQRFFSLNMRAQSSRNILQILVGVNGLSNKFDRLSSSESSPGITSSPNNTMLDSWEVPDEPISAVGLDQPLKELKMMLFNSEEVVNVLSAPGGSGKTTLVNELRKDVDVKGRYRTNIFFATVSRMPNVIAIIQTLLQQLCNQVPYFQSDKEAFNHLKYSLKTLKPDPVLCILDDVWSGSESLLESFEFKIEGFKVLVTSRSVFPRFSSTYRLKLLSDTDAMTLFRGSAFFKSSSPNFIDEDLVNEIVKKCKNNPLALKVIGRSLRGESATVWECRIRDWSKSIFSSENELLDSLRASLDALDKKLKDCLFDLASFPEDSRIPAPTLVDVWAELYKLEDDVCAMGYLHELSDRCLVDLVTTRKDGSEAYRCYNDHFITQHDILRELAIYQNMQDPVERRLKLITEINGNRTPEWLLELKHQAAEARLLSISTDENFSSNWWDMELPGVEALVLSLRSKCYCLPKFVEKMGQLRVLVIMNHGVCPTELTNFPILGSLSSVRRIRLEHISIPPICESIMKMKNLKKISLVMCKIGRAFRNSAAQLSDILPELEEIDINYCNDLKELPSPLCDLGHLKKMSITNCHKLTEMPERIGNLGKLEVLSLHACTELRELPDSIGRLCNLTFLDISKCFSLKNLPEEMGGMNNLRQFHMRGCADLSKLPTSVTNLQHLKDVFCDEETAYLWEPYRAYFTKLRIHILPENVNLNWLR